MTRGTSRASLRVGDTPLRRSRTLSETADDDHDQGEGQGPPQGTAAHPEDAPEEGHGAALNQ